MNIHSLSMKHQKLQKEISLIRQQLNTLPKGKLICTGKNKYYNWYISDGHTKVYLPKKERSLAEKLALKKYLAVKSPIC